jgi:hypothetical protein
MARIVYKMRDNGQATDLRFVKDGYSLIGGEKELVGDTLPAIETLYDESYTKQFRQNHAISVVQKHMDAKAQEYGYDHILSASTYSASTFSKFQAEGRAFAKWRDDVWTHCFNILAEWEAGTSVITTEDELIASLPEFTVTY